eukprot:m.220761 g.220761  ORF g.220761 m.220761 type:complete len:360 (-) comp10445_c0_seq1:44-1123(-)
MAALALLALAALASAMTFDEYVVQYNKQYEAKSAEWFAHEATFIARVAEIEAHNSNAGRTYDMTINQFTDMTVLERKAFLGHKRIPFAGLEEVAAPVFHTPVSDLPASVDWRTKGVVTPIKNQGQCGSCWAFATTETLESHAALTTNPPTQIILSPQQLVNCVPNPKHCGGTGGCSGATPEVGYTYLASCGGQTTEKLYPYTARDGACKFDKTTTPPAVAISGYVKIDENNYTAVMNAIANIGPIAISVEADTWFSYSSGILPASGCNLQDTDIDHNVQLVGYGTEGGKDYWIVRNSWGATWGESGYIRLARSSDGKPCSPDKEPGDGSACEPYPKEVNVCGTCGILYDTCYPVGVKIL